jgi:hypothetical protein
MLLKTQKHFFYFVLSQILKIWQIKKICLIC